MRKNIYEIISNETCKPIEEIQRLEQLFEIEQKCCYCRSMFSLKGYIDILLFRSLPIRGTSLDIDDLKDRLGILSMHDIDGLLSYCEFIYNILIQSISKIERNNDSGVVEQVKTVIDNIKWILERLNHEIIELDDMRVIIVEKNKTAAQAASLIDDPTKALKIIEYNHIGLKGNLLGKQSILKQLGDIIEPILKSHSLKYNGYGSLESDAGFLLNNFQIRHENKSGSNRRDYITAISESALEGWYDKAYNTILMVIIASDQIEVSNNIEELKQKYKW